MQKYIYQNTKDIFELKTQEHKIMMDDDKLNKNQIKVINEKIEIVQNQKNLLEKNTEILDRKIKGITGINVKIKKDIMDIDNRAEENTKDTDHHTLELVYIKSKNNERTQDIKDLKSDIYQHSLKLNVTGGSKIKSPWMTQSDKELYPILKKDKKIIGQNVMII